MISTSRPPTVEELQAFLDGVPVSERDRFWQGFAFGMACGVGAAFLGWAVVYAWLSGAFVGLSGI